MIGNLQVGSNQILNLGTLSLSGTVPPEEAGGAATALQIATPWAKARDCVAFSFASDVMTSCVLRGLYCTDGVINFEYFNFAGAELVLDAVPVNVALIRSPGWPDQPNCPIGQTGMGPTLPLTVFQATNDAGSVLTTADAEINFVVPESFGDTTPLVLNGPIGNGTAGFGIRGWRLSGTDLKLQVRNLTAGTINLGAGEMTLTGIAVAGRATPFSQRIAVQGGLLKGLVKRYASVVSYPSAPVTIPAALQPETAVFSSTVPVPAAQAPDTLRAWAWSLQGMPEGDYAITQLPVAVTPAPDQFPIRLMAQQDDGSGADSIVATDSLVTYLQSYDVAP